MLLAVDNGKGSRKLEIKLIMSQIICFILQRSGHVFEIKNDNTIL